MTSGGSAVSLPAEAGKVLYNLKFSVPIFFDFMSVKKKVTWVWCFDPSTREAEAVRSLSWRLA